jgi:HSP20 family protein
MAKISKKPPTSMSAFDVNNITRLMGEGLDDLMGIYQGEPITNIPSVDMYSTAEDLVIEVEMPGVRKDDIEVIFHKNTLTLRALKFDCFEENRINYVCMERVFGRVFRAIEIPFPVDTARIKAIYKNGILIIRIPRVEDKRSRTKKIDIELK